MVLSQLILISILLFIFFALILFHLFWGAEHFLKKLKETKYNKISSLNKRKNKNDKKTNEKDFPAEIFHLSKF